MQITTISKYFENFVQTIRHLTQLTLPSSKSAGIHRGLTIQSAINFGYRIEFFDDFAGSVFLELSPQLYYLLAEGIRKNLLDETSNDTLPESINESRLFINYLEWIYKNTLEQSDGTLPEEIYKIEQYYQLKPSGNSIISSGVYHYQMVFKEQDYYLKIHAADTQERFFDKTRIVLFNLPDPVVRQLVLDLLPQGFQIVHTQDKKMLRQYIIEHRVDLLIMDDSKELNMLSKLKYLQNLSVSGHFKTMIYTENDKKYSKLGLTIFHNVIRVLSKYDSVQSSIQSIFQSISKVKSKHIERRSSDRLYVTENQHIWVQLDTPNAPIAAIARIANLSTYGMTLVLESKEQSVKLSYQASYSFILKWDSLTLKISGSLNHINGSQLSFRFDENSIETIKNHFNFLDDGIPSLHTHFSGNQYFEELQSPSFMEDLVCEMRQTQIG